MQSASCWFSTCPWWFKSCDCQVHWKQSAAGRNESIASGLLTSVLLARLHLSNICSRVACTWTNCVFLLIECFHHLKYKVADACDVEHNFENRGYLCTLPVLRLLLALLSSRRNRWRQSDTCAWLARLHFDLGWSWYVLNAAMLEVMWQVPKAKSSVQAVMVGDAGNLAFCSEKEMCFPYQNPGA